MTDYYGRYKEVLIQGGIGQPLFIALFEDEMCCLDGVLKRLGESS